MSDTFPSRSALLYVSHFLTPGTLRTYARIARAASDRVDVYWVCQGASAQRWLSYLPLRMFAVTDEVLSSWRNVMNGNGLVPGNCHIPVLAFAEHRKYDYYWFIEYDVRFTGDWRELFAITQPSKADLITAFVDTPFEDESWYHWPTINLPYPRLARSFNPVYRMSRRVLRRIKRLLNDGYWAHNEALVASVCLNHGWPMQDLNDLAMDHWGKCVYTPTRDAGAAGTLNYRPVASMSWGGEHNKLYHPIKPLRWFIDRAGLRRGLINAWNAREDSSAHTS